MTLDDLLIDKRIVRRNIEKGRLDTATYRRLLEELPDRSGNVWRPDAGNSGDPVRAPINEERAAEPSVASQVAPMAPG